MTWQWKLGRFLGIEVSIHATFILPIGWVGYSHWLEHLSLAEVVNGVLFILALFLCVVLQKGVDCACADFSRFQKQLRVKKEKIPITYKKTFQFWFPLHSAMTQESGGQEQTHASVSRHWKMIRIHF